MKTIAFIPAVLLSVFVYGQNGPVKQMVLIPGGEFNMGKNSGYPTDWQPEHKVHIDSFYLDNCEVSNQEYYDFCIATSHSLPEFWGIDELRSGPDFLSHPVVGISLFDAEQYARWAGKRIPTEAEWEYAARGGLVDKNFPGGDTIDSTLANFGKKYKGIMPAGSFPANAYGLYDMAGNVWEWTTDNYRDDYYALSPYNNPKGPERSRFKAIRGGSWHSGAMCVQTYFRSGLIPSWVDFAVGFRCAGDVE